MTYGHQRPSILGWQIDALRARVGEPYDPLVDSDDGHFTQQDMIRFLYAAEMKTVMDLPEPMLATMYENVQRDLASGTGNYRLPGYWTGTDDEHAFLRIVSVEIQRATGQQYLQCRLYSGADAQLPRIHPAHQPTWMEPVAILRDDMTVEILPTPSANISSGLKITYIKVPRQRVRTAKMTSNGGSTTTVTVASTVYPNDFFEDPPIRCGLIFTSGDMEGVYRNVTDNATAATFVVDTMPQAPDSGDTFWVGEVSDLPDISWPLVLAWASREAYMKEKDVQNAAAAAQEYQDALASLTAQYQGVMA